jgi:hypothetical protein
MADLHASEQEPSNVERVFGRVHRAVFYQALEIPGDPVTATVQREGDSAFMLVAVDGQRVYLLTVGDLEDEMGLPQTECRMLCLQPGAGVVSQKAKYFDRKGKTAARSTIWTFRLPEDTSLMIETHFDPEESRRNDREAVARALANALGWKLDGLEQRESEPLVALSELVD